GVFRLARLGRAAGGEINASGHKACDPIEHGRGSRIRTGDLKYPKLPRYRAALYPEFGPVANMGGLCGQGRPCLRLASDDLPPFLKGRHRWNVCSKGPATPLRENRAIFSRERQPPVDYISGAIQRCAGYGKDSAKEGSP